MLRVQQQPGQEGLQGTVIGGSDAAPPAFQPPVAAHRQMSAKKKAPRLQDDASVMFMSHQTRTKQH